MGGYRIWMQVAGHGDPTVVFESGGGNDSSVWASVEPQIRAHAAVRTVVYDRAGLGKSEPAPGPYAIDHEVGALERALHKCGVRGPLVLVSHSYGGFVSTLMAASDRHVVGIVFVDANLGSFFDKAEVDHLLAKYTPQFDAFQKAKPELARVMIPIMQAYPDTATRVRSVELPLTLPVIDIVAENTWADSPAELTAMRQAHADVRGGLTRARSVVCQGQRPLRHARPPRARHRDDRAHGEVGAHETPRLPNHEVRRALRLLVRLGLPEFRMLRLAGRDERGTHLRQRQLGFVGRRGAAHDGINAIHVQPIAGFVVALDEACLLAGRGDLGARSRALFRRLCRGLCA